MLNSYSGDILTSVRNNVRTIKFNRPSKKNAFSEAMYTTIKNILNSDTNDDNIVATILTGVGEYYSSGTDLSNDNPEKVCKIIENFIAALISYPKLLIAVVNGPAVGIAVTTLALCDVVYATNRATFITPFVRLGLCPEGCSSYLFPRIMGRSKASEVLLLGRKLTAEEACKYNFVAEVISDNKVDEFINHLHKYGELSADSIKQSKKLIVDPLRETLNSINKTEMKIVEKCICGDDYKENKIGKSKL